MRVGFDRRVRYGAADIQCAVAALAAADEEGAALQAEGAAQPGVCGEECVQQRHRGVGRAAPAVRSAVAGEVLGAVAGRATVSGAIVIKGAGRRPARPAGSMARSTAGGMAGGMAVAWGGPLAWCAQ